MKTRTLLIFGLDFMGLGLAAAAVYLACQSGVADAHCYALGWSGVGLSALSMVAIGIMSDRGEI